MYLNKLKKEGIQLTDEEIKIYEDINNFIKKI
jgi:hypothetical protein